MPLLEFLQLSLLWVVILPTTAVQLVRTPSPDGDRPMMFRHDAYIDSKLRRDPVNMLNHEGWHLRSLLSSSMFDSNTSVPTFTSASKAGDAMISSTNQLQSTGKISRSGATSIFTTLPPTSVLALSKHATPEPLQRFTSASGLETSDWDNVTEIACRAHLSKLHGMASNPSGNAVCYNIQDIDSLAGIFNAEARLYRVAQAFGDWTDLQRVGLTIGLSYKAATVQLKPAPKIGPREPLVYRKSFEPHAMRLLQKMSFIGQVSQNSIGDLNDRSMALDLLRPKINIAGQRVDGRPVSTQLSLAEASFVNGLFANQTRTPPVDDGSTLAAEIQSTAWILEANAFSTFPVGVVLASAWSLTLLAVSGWEIFGRIRVRNEDRKRMRVDLIGGWEMIWAS